MDKGRTYAHHSYEPSDGLRVVIAVGPDTQTSVWLLLIVINARDGEERRDGLPRLDHG